jgi:plasmid stability protein
MATLYVENVPDDVYKALRDRARQHRKSITAEVLSLLAENVVTATERKARQQFLRQVRRLRSQRSGSTAMFPASEELQREDRGR